MSVKGQALKALVMEKLVVAADEIFALFEQSFAEYQAEVLRSKLLQQPRVVLYREDIQTVTVGADSCSKPIQIKQEEGPSLEIPLASITVKSEENVNESTLPKQEPAEENRHNLVGEQCEGEALGCSLTLHLDNNEQNESFDTDNPEDWEFLFQRIPKNNGMELNASHSNDSAQDKANYDNSTAVLANDGENRDELLRCTQCFKSFQSKEILEIHLQIHAKKRSFICKTCNKSFIHKSSYKQHLQIHSDQNPNRCSICQRGFTKKHHLQEHMRIHSDERPFSCADCGLRFRQRNARKKHYLRMHSEQMPYTCSVCQKGFVEKWLYVAHMMTKHPGK